MAGPPVHNQTQNTNVKLPRVYCKCKRCRDKHLKCLPVDRDWSQGQRCANCIKANAPCGRNTRFNESSVNDSETCGISSPQTAPPDTPSTQTAGSSFEFSAAVLQSSPSINSQDLNASQSEPVSSAQDARGHQGKQVESPDAYDASLIQVRQISDLGEALDYLWDRRNAVKELEAAFSLPGLDSLIRAFDFCLFAISNLAVPALRTIDHLRLNLSNIEQELLARRTLDALQPVLAYHQSKQSGPALQSCNWPEVDELIGRLTGQYGYQGHQAEARFISTIAHRRQQYLSGCNMSMLETLAITLQITFSTAFRSIPNDYREDIIPKGGLLIDAGYLAVLAGRHGFSIEPGLCGTMTQPDILGRNELLLGAERCDLPYVKWAIESRKKAGKTSSLESRDKFGVTALMISIYRGCLEIFQLLVKEGASLDARDPQGRNIPCLASICGYLPIIEEIFGLHVLMLDNIKLYSPIHEAAGAGAPVHVIRLLMHYGADPRELYEGYENLPASQIAARNGHEKIAAVLEEYERQLDNQVRGTKPTSHQSETIRSLEIASLTGTSMSESTCSSSSSKHGARRTRKRARQNSPKSQASSHNGTTMRQPILASQHASPEALNQNSESSTIYTQPEADNFGFNPFDFVNFQDNGFFNQNFPCGSGSW